jgi:putative transposase
VSAVKKLVAPAGLRAAVSYVEMEYEMSERHACRLMGLGRSTHRYGARREERDAELRARLKDLAAQRMQTEAPQYLACLLSC